MLQNADQSRNEDYRAQNFEEEEAGPLSFMPPNTKFVPSLANPRSFQTSRKILSQNPDQYQVEEEPGQQDFNDKQLNNITNTDLLAVMADQQGQYSHHNDREDKMQDAVHSCSKYEAG